jgi:hypothetical protein
MGGNGCVGDGKISEREFNELEKGLKEFNENYAKVLSSKSNHFSYMFLYQDFPSKKYSMGTICRSQGLEFIPIIEVKYDWEMEKINLLENGRNFPESYLKIFKEKIGEVNFSL